MPRVSVIVPNYNHASFLEQRIESILSQSFQDFELLLLDDCSSDGSRDILERYQSHPKVSHVVFNPDNGGSAFRQWKKGVALAQGEWVWIAESDDWAEPTFLETMLASVEQHPSCVMVSSLPRYVFPDGTTWSRTSSEEGGFQYGKDFVKHQLLKGNGLPNVSALLLRRDALQKLDFTRIETMRLCGDWLLYAQLCSMGDVMEVNQELSNFRRHDDSASAVEERRGLTFIEGSEVLAYMVDTFQIPSACYARSWGRSWARLERKYHYDKSVKTHIRQQMRPFPKIRCWHDIYRWRIRL